MSKARSSDPDASGSLNPSLYNYVLFRFFSLFYFFWILNFYDFFSLFFLVNYVHYVVALAV